MARWELTAQTIFRALGFEVHRTLPGADYVQCLPFTYSTYHPWFDPQFQATYSAIAPRTEVTADRCYTLQQLCQHCLHIAGDVVECGVYRGGTAHLLATTIADSRSSARLHLFDTFAGMPKAADLDPSHHRQGDFGDITLQSVQTYLSPYAERIEYYPGVIPQTFPQDRSLRFSFAHIDVDLYRSVFDCCAYIYPRMTPGGMMVFDDYGMPHYKEAAKKAVDDFFRGKVESPIVLRTGQCLVIKLPSTDLPSP